MTTRTIIPRPGSPVRGSRTGAPIMALFDLLGRRWAMGIVWNLHDGPHTFRELQSRCDDLSPSVLNVRIRELREARILRDGPGGYALTPLGRRLFALIEPLGTWSKAWARALAEERQ